MFKSISTYLTLQRLRSSYCFAFWGLAAGVIISFLLFPHASLAKVSEPYMPASVQKVLQDMGAAPDVLEIVSGGWGYSQDKAMIIGNPYKGKDEEFKPAPLEYELMEIRDQEEFYIVPPDGKRFLPLLATMLKQSMVDAPGGKHYDKMEMQVLLLPEQYWQELKPLADANKSVQEVAKHFKGKTVTVNRDYWFDVSEPYAHNGKVVLKRVKK